MADLQASYDSLESSTIPKSQQQQKYMMAILSLLAIGKHNQTVIQNEIDSYLQASTRDDQRLADMRRRIAKDLKDTLDCLDIPSEMEAELGEKAEFVKRFIRDVPDTSDVDSATFRNRYVIHAMHLKWDNSVRDLIYRLLYAFEEEKELNYVRCRPAVEYLEELVKKAENMAHDHRHGTKSANHTTSSEDNDNDHHHNDHHHSEEPHHDHNIFNPLLIVSKTILRSTAYIPKVINSSIHRWMKKVLIGRPLTPPPLLLLISTNSLLVTHTWRKTMHTISPTTLMVHRYKAKRATISIKLVIVVSRGFSRILRGFHQRRSPIMLISSIFRRLESSWFRKRIQASVFR